MIANVAAESGSLVILPHSEQTTSTAVDNV